ncbi:hypothetical protein LZ31DRAFT_560939 [Colletotrichum somersetense]|nr:hypothetical protein LZ31DRAFT_560939 [Colletotrichum somersetense]
MAITGTHPTVRYWVAARLCLCLPGTSSIHPSIHPPVRPSVRLAILNGQGPRPVWC